MVGTISSFSLGSKQEMEELLKILAELKKQGAQSAFIRAAVREKYNREKRARRRRAGDPLIFPR